MNFILGDDRMKKICRMLILALMICILFSHGASAETTDDWQQYFFLPEDGRDLRLLWEDYLQHEDWDSEYGLAGTLAQYGSCLLYTSNRGCFYSYNKPVNIVARYGKGLFSGNG